MYIYLWVIKNITTMQFKDSFSVLLSQHVVYLHLWCVANRDVAERLQVDKLYNINTHNLLDGCFSSLPFYKKVTLVVVKGDTNTLILLLYQYGSSWAFKFVLLLLFFLNCRFLVSGLIGENVCKFKTAWPYRICLFARARPALDFKEKKWSCW